MLASRSLSGASASCSGRQGCPAVINNTHHVAPLRMSIRQRRATRMAAAEQFEVEEQGEEEMIPIKASLFTAQNPYNLEPNYQDPDWFDKVTDWDEFWNHTRWDMEAHDFEADEYDMTNAPFRGRSTRSHERVYEMLRAFKEIEGRSDVANLLTAQSRREHIGVYDQPPVEPETQPELPPWTEVDWRAFAEKQRQKDLMDIEWRRKQAKVGKLAYPHKDVVRDVRMRAFDYLGESFDWSHEDMYNLITQNGTAARPEDHKAWVENPLVPVDYVNVMGVTHIEETEDFLDRIGHLATPKELEKMSEDEMHDIIDHAHPDAAEELVRPTLDNIMFEAEEEQRKIEGNTW